MGCHTWSYKKVTALTKDEIQKIVDEEIKDAESWWGFNHNIEELTKIVEKWYVESPELFETNNQTPKEYAENLIHEYTEKLNKVKEEGISYILKKYKKDESSNVESANLQVINDESYWCIGFDEPFRVYGYPEETFTNKEALFSFLKNTKNVIGYYDYVSFDFHKGYTDELVKRINDYFKKHGEDNLYFEFG